jgi:hypothetical protein
MVGRRDAALVALVCTAGLTRRQIRTLHSEVDGDGLLVAPTLPALPSTPRPGECPACAVTRWLRVHAMVVTGGWRTVRADLADLGETPAGTGTTHDCTQPVTWPVAAGERATSPLFTPIDPRGSPETWALSTRSVTTIVATGRRHVRGTDVGADRGPTQRAGVDPRGCRPPARVGGRGRRGIPSFWCRASRPARRSSCRVPGAQDVKSGMSTRVPPARADWWA